MFSPCSASGNWFYRSARDLDFILLDIFFSPEYRDSALELLWELDTLGIEEREEESRISFRSYFDSSRSVSQLKTLFEREAGRRQLAFERLDVSLVDWSEEEWLINCKRHFRGVQVGETFNIHPSWEKPSESQPVNILIEPGRAFGTGTHESTQLCLLALSVLAKQAGTMLDVGTGSGILSIAARLLNPSLRIVAMDIDREVVSIARENCEKNEITNIGFFAGSINCLQRPFDLVVANLTLGIFRESARELVRLSGNHLIVSGFTDDQIHLVVDLFSHDFPFYETDSWSRNG